MSKKKQTVGYWYGLGFHAVYCHGPVDAVTAVRVGERTAWKGWADSNTDLVLHARDLFGGEAREGGIDGTLRLRLGGADQPADPYLQSRIGGLVPAFRGVLSAIWDGLVSANNPYIKPWSLRAFRKPSLPWDTPPLPGEGWQTYLYDPITGGVNAAWIIYECLTNPEWGCGQPHDDIDVESFTIAASGWRRVGNHFGYLSLIWDRESSIEAFIALVLRHVNGVLFRNPHNGGRWTLRGIYHHNSIWPLGEFGPHNVLAVESFARPALAELVNEVTVRWRDWDTDEPQTLTVQNPAAIETMGGISATTIDYPGITHRDDAWKAALRDLRNLSYPAAQITFVANREASYLLPTDVIWLTWPELGIQNLRLRVVNVGYGVIDDGRVRVQCVEDAVTSAYEPYIWARPPEGGLWQPIDHTPYPSEHVDAIELPYYLVAREIARGTETSVSELTPDDAFVALLASRPPGVPLRIEAWAYGEQRGDGAWTPTAVTAAAVPVTEAPVTLSISDGLALEMVQPGPTALAMLGEELCRIDAIDPTAGTVTLARGVADTVPRPHPAGTRLWFIDDRIDLDERWLAGETLNIKAITVASAGRLDYGPGASIHLVGRQHLPYPPACLRIDGEAYPASVSGSTVTITWEHRDRRTQTADLIDQTAGSIGPEPGVTYTLRAWRNGSLFETAPGLTGTSHTLTPPGPGVLRIEIEAVRDGYHSHQALTWEGGYTP